jgi:excisionase family DNA binding protein
MNERDELLTVPEVALTLRQSASSVYRKLEAGDLPGVKIGAGPRAPWRVKSTDLDRFLTMESNR